MTRAATFAADYEIAAKNKRADAVRVVQIGLAGGIGVCHINEYARNPHFKLVGGFDLYPLDEKVAEASARLVKMGGRIYGSFAEVLGDQGVEAIDICAPHHFHREMAVAAFEAGKHVMVEKPMAPHPEDVEAMIAAAKKAGKVGAVQMQHVGRSSMLELRREIQAGAIGELQEVFLSSLWYRTEGYYERAKAPNDWPGRMKVDGKWCIDGALFNQCVHYITQALILCGEDEEPVAAGVREVEAGIYKFHEAPKLEAGDTAFARGMIDSGDGPRLTLIGTTCSAAERHQIDILGTKGRALWNGTGYLFVNGEPMKEFQDDRGEFDGNSRVFTSFAEAVRGRGKAITAFENVRESTKFIFGCYEAAGWEIKKAPWGAAARLFTDVFERVRGERKLPRELVPRVEWA